MKVFNHYFDEMKQILTSDSLRDQAKISSFNSDLIWEKGMPGEIILSSDTAIELGHPLTESIAFLIWSEDVDRVQDGRITLIGPELDGIILPKAPLGKVILAGVHGFTEDNAYDRFQEMDMIRLRLGLKGYMLRAVPQNNREWVRVSKQALKEGLSLRMIGNELIREYRRLEYVDAAEVTFITSSREDILKLKPASEKVAQIIGAMNKIFDNLEYDCQACGFKNVCDEVGELRGMHKKVKKKE
jgi:CO dehydrogenase/acetyl-CoA synthase beta subunit